MAIHAAPLVARRGNVSIEINDINDKHVILGAIIAGMHGEELGAPETAPPPGLQQWDNFTTGDRMRHNVGTIRLSELIPWNSTPGATSQLVKSKQMGWRMHQLKNWNALLERFADRTNSTVMRLYLVRWQTVAMGIAPFRHVSQVDSC